MIIRKSRYVSQLYHKAKAVKVSIGYCFFFIHYVSCSIPEIQNGIYFQVELAT